MNTEFDIWYDTLIRNLPDNDRIIFHGDIRSKILLDDVLLRYNMKMYTERLS